MKRRTLLQSALALPMNQTSPHPQTRPLNWISHDNDPACLFSGLPGLDYAIGGIRPHDLICVVGAPSTGKTLLLLDLAARLCSRSGQNVVFYSRHQPSVYLAKKGAIKADVTYALADAWLFDCHARGINGCPAVILLDSTLADLPRAHQVAEFIVTEHPAACAAIIIDGQNAAPMRRRNTGSVDEVPTILAERWTPTRLSVSDLYEAQRFAQGNSGVSIVMGITTASLADDKATADSLDLDAHMRFVADRFVTLHRPELYVDTSQARAADRNVVCLSGTSPRWWDTRCSRLRFDPLRLAFSTVI